MEPARIIDDYFFVIFSLFGVVTSWIIYFSMFSTFHIPQLASWICPFLVKSLVLLEKSRGQEPFGGGVSAKLWTPDERPPRDRERERELSLITSVESWVIEEHHMHVYIYASSKTNVRWFDVPKQWNMTAILKTVDYFFRAHWHKNPVVPQAAAAFWGYSGFPTSYG